MARVLHARRGTAMQLRTGIDLVRVADVADSIDHFGDRYLHRVYTGAEIDTCAGSPAATAQGLAARFAAKEAVLKVLGVVSDPPPWRTIEVVRAATGGVRIRLHGAAAAAAGRARIADLSVSITHEHDHAAAVVVARCTAPETRMRYPS